MWLLQTQDNRELMQSRSLIKDCCAMRIELLSNATVVDRVVQFVAIYDYSLKKRK